MAGATKRHSMISNSAHNTTNTNNATVDKPHTPGHGANALVPNAGLLQQQTILEQMIDSVDSSRLNTGQMHQVCAYMGIPIIAYFSHN